MTLAKKTEFKIGDRVRAKRKMTMTLTHDGLGENYPVEKGFEANTYLHTFLGITSIIVKEFSDEGEGPRQNFNVCYGNCEEMLEEWEMVK